MTTPEEDITPGGDPYRLSGAPPDPVLAKMLAENAEVRSGTAGITNLLGAETYGRIRGEDPAKAMLKSSEAMLEEVKEQTKYLRDTVEMLRQSNELSQRQAEVIKQAVREVSHETREAITMGARGMGAPTRPGGLPVAAGQAPDGVVDPSDLARMSTESGGGLPTAMRDDPDEVAERRKAMAQRLYAAQSKPIDTLRTEFFSGVARKISEYEPSDDLRYAARLEEMAGVEGSATRALGRRSSLAAGARNVAGNVAEKGVRGGLMSSLANSGLARMAGTGALVVGAANAGLDFAENQREDNRAYQAATGDSNVGGFAFRARQNMFGLSQRGRMGSEEAQRLYGQVTMMNTDEQTRAEALDFASDAFMRFGQSVDQSIQMIEAAIERGETNFAQLTSSLENVTDAAAMANVNAEAARSIFNQQLGVATGRVGTGQGSTQLAETATLLQTALGPTMQDAQFDLLNPYMVETFAASQGLSRNQVLAGLQTGQQTGAFFAHADAQIEPLAQGFFQGGSLGRIRQQLEAEAAANGMTLAEFRAADPERFNQAQREAITSEEAAGNVADRRQVSQILQSRGISAATEEDALALAASSALGFGYEETATAHQRQRDKDLGLSAATADAAYAEGSVMDTIRERTGVQADANLNLFGLGTTTDAEFQSKLANVYGSVIGGGISTQQDVQFSGVLEDLLPQLESGQQFVVQTKGGRRVVSAEEAIRNFSDQLQAGTAEVFGGGTHGKTVADVLGFEAGSAGTTGITGESDTASREDLAGVGMSVEEAAAQRREQAGDRLEGRIIVEPGPGLIGPNGQPLLEFIWDMDVAEANRRGIPAPSTRGG